MSGNTREGAELGGLPGIGIGIGIGTGVVARSSHPCVELRFFFFSSHRRPQFSASGSTESDITGRVELWR